MKTADFDDQNVCFFGLVDIGCKRGAYISANNQTTCTSRAAITLATFPDNTVIDYLRLMEENLLPSEEEAERILGGVRGPGCN